MTTTEWKEKTEGFSARQSLLVTLSKSRYLPLAAVALGSSLFYIAFFLFMQETGARPMRLSPTLTLQRWPEIAKIVRLITPSDVITASWKSQQAIYSEIGYAVAVLGLLGCWIAALWFFRPGGYTLSLKWILFPIGLFSLPLIWLPGLTSPDIYLYTFYGRIISSYNQNPFNYAPSHFSTDSHYGWVNWKELPSAYGPLWLMLSGGLSAVAGENLFSNIFVYKVAMLAMHVLLTLAIWLLLNDLKPRLATWGAVFYGWNPMVLAETVGNAHNDIMMALFVVLSLVAGMRNRWLWAICLLMAAVMVKMTALIFVPFLILAWILHLESTRERIRAVILSAVAIAVVGVGLYIPLWAGPALIHNVRTNPAATAYQNSIWQLITLHFVAQPVPYMNVFTVQQFYDQLARWNSAAHNMNIIRSGIFAVVYILLLVLFVRRKQGLAEAWLWVWFAYCATAGWIWPWYFVTAVPLAVLTFSKKCAVFAAALTLGGLIFWTGWPDPALPAIPWLHDFKSVLMIGPGLIVAAVLLLDGKIQLPDRITRKSVTT